MNAVRMAGVRGGSTMAFTGASGFTVPATNTISLDASSLQASCALMMAQDNAGIQYVGFGNGLRVCFTSHWRVRHKSSSPHADAAPVGSGAVASATTDHFSIAFAGSSAEFFINSPQVDVMSGNTAVPAEVTIIVEGTAFDPGTAELSNFVTAPSL